MPVAALIGGQYGSEGKGALAGALARRWDTHVRVGAANAGHTLYVNGEKHVLQQLPCAAYANPEARLALGPGALISSDILASELEHNRKWREHHGHPPLELLVDYRAQVIGAEHKRREAASDLAARIGSTSARAGEGIGEAQAARVLRDASVITAAHAQLPAGCILADVPAWLEERHSGGILLEGAQGTGLSNITGQFPYVTSRDTSAAGLAADSGLGPRDLDEVLMVVRSFPIRVAGGSGPFWPGSQELAWNEVGVPAEHTTVTGLERRVASFSVEQVEYAARLNSATHIALTFCDYVEPSLADRGQNLDLYDCVITPDELDRDYPRLAQLVRAIEDATGVPVSYLGCGPDAVMAYASELEEWGMVSSLVNHRLSTWRTLVAHRAYNERGWRFDGQEEFPKLDAAGFPMVAGHCTTAPGVEWFLPDPETGHLRECDAFQYAAAHREQYEHDDALLAAASEGLTPEQQHKKLRAAIRAARGQSSYRS